MKQSPAKKHKRTATTLNNNKTSHTENDKDDKNKHVNGGHKTSQQQPQQTGNGSENGIFNGYTTNTNHDLNIQPLAKSASGSKRRPVGRPPKKYQSPIKTLKPKQAAQRISKRLHDHSMKDWPYHHPPTPELKKEVPQKKKKRIGPHRESTKVKSLRKLPPLSIHKNGQVYISVNFFNSMFVNFKMDTNCLLSMLALIFGDPGKDFVFKKWQITHLSLRAAQEIVNVMKKPLFLAGVLDQIQTLPIVSLKKVSPETYKKTHLTQLSRNEFCNLFALGPTPTRVSMRTKQPTKKLLDSPCLTSMATLSSSITSPPKKSSNTSSAESSSTESKVNAAADLGGIKQTKEEILKSIGKSWVSGKLRPKFRKLLNKKPKISPEENQQAKNDEAEDFSSYLAEVAADENEIIMLEEDEEAFDELVDNANSRLQHVSPINNELVKPKETDTGVFDFKEETTNTTPELLPAKSRIAVRKFPSYGWSREREARIRIEMNKTEMESPPAAVPIPAKKSLARNLPDFPPFQLSGLVETAPKEVEGWFTSKVALLRQLSEASTPSTKSSSPNSSRSGSGQKKASSTSKKPQKPRKVPVKVFLDNDVETVVDLLEYKQNLEQINSIIEEIESTTAAAAAAAAAAAEKNSSNQKPETEVIINDQVINETLRVAKKIEKISIAGIGRQVSLPSPQSFLPPGWHCRKTDHDGKEYINSDGFKVKSIQAAIKHEAKAERRSSMRKNQI